MHNKRIFNLISACAFVVVWISLILTSVFRQQAGTAVLAVIPALLLSAGGYLISSKSWNSQRRSLFLLHIAFISLIILPSSITSIFPLRSLLICLCIFTILLSSFAWKQAFTSSSYGLLSPLGISTIIATAGFFLVLMRIITRATLQTNAMLPWFSLTHGYSDAARAFDHMFSLLLVMAFPIVITTAGALKNRIWKSVWSIAGMIIICGIVLSFCRAAWVALAIQIIALLILHRKQRRTILIGAVLCLAIALLIPGVRQRADSIFQLSLNTNAERLRQWQASCVFISRAPLLGHGLGTFGDLYQKYSGINTTPYYSCPHNLYLHIAVECGFPALAAFLSWMFLLLKNLYRDFSGGLNKQAQHYEPILCQGMFVSLVGILAFALFDL